ncbi:helix-turn-helix domain-containing protein [Actinocorallia longicatena]|uniref:HTH tetR-type domain-containing protein n=1 Tax=Actinocorallia longicatena TaxID=111803 RepID=A0ABP6QRK2_9ACTN
MPKITEPTVAEHRARQLRVLLDAGRTLVAEEGLEALSLAALSRRVGLSRPSLYEYFGSRDDLVAAILEEELPDWAAALTEAIGGAGELRGKIEAYVAVHFEAVSDGRHAAATRLVEHARAEPARARIRAGHTRLLAPLTGALEAAGVPAPRLRAALVQGMIETAAALAERDPGAREQIAATVVDQALAGLTGDGG